MSTADLADAFGSELHFCDLRFQKFGKREFISGEVQTIQCFEDNGLLRAELAKPGHGKVIVVDGGGSTKVALMGDQMAALINANGWGGVIIHGAVRDSVQLATMDIAVFCTSLTPKPPQRAGTGTLAGPLVLGSADIVPGSYIYADSDGVLVSETEKKLP